METRGRSVLALAAVALTLTVPAAALGGNGNGAQGDVVHLGDVKVKKPKKQDLPAAVPAESRAAVAAAAAEESPPLGTKKIWPTINLLTGGVSTLERSPCRASGRRSRSGSPNNLDFPAGDCRNDGVRNVITAAQSRTSSTSSTGTCTRRCRRRSARRRPATATAALLEQLAPALVPTGLLTRAGRQGRHPDRELPRRELHRHQLPVLRRGLPLVATSTRSSSGT